MRFLAIVALMMCAGCVTKDNLSKTLNDNPEIIYDFIKKNPGPFMMALREAAQNEQTQSYADREKMTAKKMEEDFKNPRKVTVDPKKILVGEAGAPITIIKYADFQCPACRMGFESLEKIKEKYKGKIRFIHKNIPLSMHPQAMIAAQIYESLLYTDKKKALAFYKKAYSEQGKWRSEDAVWAMAKSVGANKKAIEAVIKKGEVDKSIALDEKEHAEQGFEGTPAYIINGVAMYGAQPVEAFSAVIDRHLKGTK
jgi:protein-disulfide isomerase